MFVDINDPSDVMMGLAFAPSLTAFDNERAIMGTGAGFYSLAAAVK